MNVELSHGRVGSFRALMTFELGLAGGCGAKERQKFS